VPSNCAIAVRQELTKSARRQLQKNIPDIAPWTEAWFTRVFKRENDTPPMSSELLPKVDLWRISDEARQALIQLVKQSLREALEEQGLKKPPVPTGALRGADAAAYLGVGRSHFYGLLKEDPQLLGLSFTVGRCRMWPIAGLDEWMQLRRVGTSSHASTLQHRVRGTG
jgi:hypothetical protein